MARAMGIDPATKKYVPFDIANKKFTDQLLKYLHHPSSNGGHRLLVDRLAAGKYTALRCPDVNPTFWLNYVHFTDSSAKASAHSSSIAGADWQSSLRQIGFSGDTISVWSRSRSNPTLPRPRPTSATLLEPRHRRSQPGAVWPELYTRWIQFGTFSPILRTHTTKKPDAERRIWAYPEPYASHHARLHFCSVTRCCHTSTRESRKTYDTGVAFLRPL